MKIKYLFVVIIISNFCFSQWNPNTSMNTPIAVMSGKQNDARIMEDGYGGAFITWKDARPGTLNPDIYVQRINSAGNILWNLNGLAVCTDLSDQSTPNITTDMQGGVIISWTDRRNNGERDVYAQRIDSTGNILWTSNGVPVAIKPNREHNEKITSDDAGGAIIVWEEYDTLNFVWDVRAQRINSAGNIVWPFGGLKLSTTVSNKLNPKLQRDKRGGAIVTWQDFRNGLDYDIYAQRISSTGALLWGNTAKSVSSVAGAQINPKIDPDSATRGVYIAWQDARNGLDYDIYCQKLDSNGTTLWTNNGVAVCNSSFNQSAVDIISNAQINGVILTWKDSRSGNEDIYASKINSNGTIAWQQNGKLIATSPYSQINPNICSDGAAGAIITWQDSTVNDWDVYAQKIDGNGSIKWATNGVVVSDAIEIQGHPKNIPDGQGGSIFVWQDKRSGFYDIYCHHIYYDGFNVGFNDVKEDFEVSAYPNPFQDEIKLTFADVDIKNFKCELFDAHGRIVSGLPVFFTYIEDNQCIKILTKDLGPGIYFLKIEKPNYSKSIKFLKN